MTQGIKIEICSIVKNEARYIAEWLEYHFGLGIAHITLYNNGSEDNLSEVCSYFDNVTLVEWPERGNQQRTAYQHYLRRSKFRKVWTAFIDADEFIFDACGTGLNAFVEGLDYDVGGLEMPWVIFDSNNNTLRPKGLVLENYTRKHAVAPQQNVKTLCRPEAINEEDFRCPHRFSYREGFRSVEVSLNELPLFHYMLRSTEDVWLKVTRGDVWSRETERKRLCNVERAVRSILDKYDNGDTPDFRMLRFVPELREKLQRRGVYYDDYLVAGRSSVPAPSQKSDPEHEGNIRQG
ncbi:hypothetical protein J2X20_004597 [Pelomonas saccharophila]|uniref:Glycosyl transferase family 2 n=2 Tax=Roseateles saccharophilus TaxID=304 RepID=A0ABU1YST8_ROSSA|nr:hypothetical protein [Roseateles saccharophilus]